MWNGIGNELLDGNSLNLFAQRLVAEGLISEQAIETASQQASESDIPLVSHLAKQNLVEPALLAKIASKLYGLPLYNLSAHNKELIPEDFLQLDVVKQRYALPILKKGGSLLVAVVDPDAHGLRDLGIVTGLRVEFAVVEADKLNQMLDHVSEPSAAYCELPEVNFDEFAELEVNAYDDDDHEDYLSYDIDDTPVVRFVNKILIDAIQSKTSDIHFEAYEKLYRVRYRQDGILHEVASPPTKLAHSIVARIKVMANLDISEHRIPQDGRFKLTMSKDYSVDFRVSTCPTLHGEKVVMRILDPSTTKLEIATLGLDPTQEKHFLDAIKLPQGMILVTGPTGSGKTVSLYSALTLLNTEEKNTSTIEDPVEIYMQGINQVQVNNKTGMTFSAALRSFLRQDPDVMMVGEIRDLETAEIAVKAAQTGHLVLSTLHTNSAPVTITRLINMGVEPFNIASSVVLVMAQRLVRRLCPSCKKPVQIDHQQLIYAGALESEVADYQCHEAVGCNSCVAGYKGRTGIYEVMPISSAMSQTIMNGGNAIELAKQARSEGVASLRESGLAKVRAGITSLDEVMRVSSG